MITEQKTDLWTTIKFSSFVLTIVLVLIFFYICFIGLDKYFKALFTQMNISMPIVIICLVMQIYVMIKCLIFLLKITQEDMSPRLRDDCKPFWRERHTEPTTNIQNKETFILYPVASMCFNSLLPCEVVGLSSLKLGTL